MIYAAIKLGRSVARSGNMHVRMTSFRLSSAATPICSYKISASLPAGILLRISEYLLNGPSRTCLSPINKNGKCSLSSKPINVAAVNT